MAPNKEGSTDVQLASNIWCGATNKYVPGPNSKSTGRNVHVNYGSGSFSGDEYTDSVTFS